MIIFRLLRISLVYFFPIILGIIFACLSVGSSIGLMMTGAYLITLAGMQSSISALQLSIVGVRFFGISRGVFRYVERIYTHEAIFKLLKRYRVWFFHNLAKIAPAGLFKHNSADLMQRLVSDIENLDNFYIKIIVPFTTSIVVAVVLTSIFYSMNKHVGYFTIALLIVAIFILPSIIYLVSKLSAKKIINLNGKFSSIIMDLIYGNEDLRMFSKYNKKLDSAYSINCEIHSSQKKLNFGNSISVATLQLIIGLGVIGIVIIGRNAIYSLHMPSIYLPVLTLGLIAAFESILSFNFSIQKLSSIVESSKRIFEIIDFKETKQTSKNLHKIERSVNPDIAISFDNVSFSYKSRDNFMLKSISLEIKKNTFSLILGESGAGKSSLINLLMRFWNPLAGQIYINGENSQDLDENTIPGMISVCQQKLYFFNATILENLTENNSSATYEDVVEALKIAQAYDFVFARKDGLNTICGEFGHNFSGGELRRLSIARTILSKADILVFDEPLAGIDYKTGRNIINNLMKLKTKRSIIIITHILTNEMINADTIYIFKDGSIQNRGTHNSLLNSNDEFYKKLNTALTILTNDDILQYENE